MLEQSLGDRAEARKTGTWRGVEAAPAILETVSEHGGTCGKFYKEGGGHTEVLTLSLAWS